MHVSFEEGNFVNSFTGKVLPGGVTPTIGPDATVITSTTLCKSGVKCLQVVTNPATWCGGYAYGPTTLTAYYSRCANAGIRISPQPLSSSTFSIAMWVYLDGPPAVQGHPILSFAVDEGGRSAGMFHMSWGVKLEGQSGWKYNNLDSLVYGRWSQLALEYTSPSVNSMQVRYFGEWGSNVWVDTQVAPYRHAGKYNTPFFVVGGAVGRYDDIVIVDGAWSSFWQGVGSQSPAVTPSSLVCSTCSSGHVRVEGVCQVCPVGFYCPNENSQVQCPANTYSLGGAMVGCFECPYGGTGPAGGTSLYDCACADGSIWGVRPIPFDNPDMSVTYDLPGYNYWAIPVTCTACSGGSYSSANGTVCINCPALAPTTLVSSLTSVSDCKCAQGYMGTGASRDAEENIGLHHLRGGVLLPCGQFHGVHHLCGGDVRGHCWAVCVPRVSCGDLLPGHWDERGYTVSGGVLLHCGGNCAHPLPVWQVPRYDG